MTIRALIPSVLLPALSAVAGEAAAGQYKVSLNKPAQVIWGLGFEIQSDSIGSGNNGLPEKPVCVPHDLAPAERQRFYKDMLRGFRYCRLALGLYVRGYDADQKLLAERYPGQMADLVEMARESALEGFEPEYWSPLPYWKSNGSYTGQGGKLKSFDEKFLNEFGAACVADVRFLEAKGLKVVQWGLQNEPGVGHGRYSTCVYTPQEYLKAFKAVAPQIRAAFPKVQIHATSWDGQGGQYGTLVQADAEALRYVDAWTWHRIGHNSNELIEQRPMFTANAHGKPVYNNEYEYLDNKTSEDRFVNTAQNIMNWFVFADAPTWYWLHALKPTYNAGASGYSLGLWRPEDDDKPGEYPDLKKGHWVYNPNNFNAIAGFLKHMPWDSRRIHTEEDTVRKDNRILAYKTPAGRLVVVLSNRGQAPFTFNVATGVAQEFAGFRYTPAERDTALGRKPGKELSVTLAPLSVEFWVEQE